MKPCSWPEGIDIRPDGVHSLSPHNYELDRRLKNVTVEILKCKRCGEYSISWEYQPDTVDITEEG